MTQFEVHSQRALQHLWKDLQGNLINCLKWRHSRSRNLFLVISNSAALTDKIQLINLCLFIPPHRVSGCGEPPPPKTDDKENSCSWVKIPPLTNQILMTSLCRKLVAFHIFYRKETEMSGRTSESKVSNCPPVVFFCDGTKACAVRRGRHAGMKRGKACSSNKKKQDTRKCTQAALTFLLLFFFTEVILF